MMIFIKTKCLDLHSSKIKSQIKYNPGIYDKIIYERGNKNEKKCSIKTKNTRTGAVIIVF